MKLDELCRYMPPPPTFDIPIDAYDRTSTDDDDATSPIAWIGKAKLVSAKAFGDRSDFFLSVPPISFEDPKVGRDVFEVSLIDENLENMGRMCHYVVLFANTIRDARDEVVDAYEKCRAVEAVVAKVKNVEAEARSAMSVIEVEVQCLKKALNKVENKLALERKEKLAVLANITKAEKEMEGRVMEVGHLAVEAFKGSKEFSIEKI
ncbi:hypothetical protein COCNU_scaffold022069G000030 [Cocos nucifera]|nr:hypothetical protein [Cocos nucifera]